MRAIIKKTEVIVMKKVNFDELKSLNFEDGEKLLKQLGYCESDSGRSEATISDYVLDRYFKLYDNENNELDIISYAQYCNGEFTEELGSDGIEVVKEGWSDSCREI